jgi:glycosyltransferase involved in cell wall biosynthesis
MNIVSINTLYEPYVGGGAEISLRSIVRGLAERGHNCHVISTCAPGQGSAEQIDDISVTRIPVRNVYWHFSDRRESAARRAIWHWNDQWNAYMLEAVEKVLSASVPDVVFMHNLTGFSSALWQIRKRLNVPVVQVLHDYYSICPKSTMFSGSKRCTRQCMACRFLRRRHAVASSGLSAVVGVSDAVLNQHLRYGYFRDVPIKRVINNARGIPPPAAKSKVGQPFRFGFIGTLAEPKGVEILLAAFERLSLRSNRSIELLVAGTGKADYVAMLKMRFTTPSIKFLGRVTPEEFFGSVDVSVVPSIWEDPFPGVVFESLGFGVPVIGNALGGIPEMVQDGINGVLLPPEQFASALDDVMIHLLENPEMVVAMAANARASVTSLLNPVRQLDEYELLIQDVLVTHD